LLSKHKALDLIQREREMREKDRGKEREQGRGGEEGEGKGRKKNYLK
jgi:hypothetical protein